MRINGYIALAMLLVVLPAGFGCDQSLSEENAFLRQENEQLRQQLAAQEQEIASMPVSQPPLATPTPAPAPVEATRTYTVKAGDTLSSISRQMYGTPGQWRVIYEANRALIGADVNRLKVGTKLKIPPLPADPVK